MKSLIYPIGLLLCVVSFTAAGCQDRAPAKAPASTTSSSSKKAPGVKAPVKKASAKDAWTRVDVAGLTPAQAEQLARAKKAQAGLGQSLMKTLKGAMGKDGPKGAVEVCNLNASPIAGEVAKVHKVKIGRTSHKLRNPNNAAPAWMSDVVSQKQKTVQVFKHTDGRLGYTAPIMFNGLCVTCHGTLAQIAPEVKSILAGRYPKDQAIGFQPGDLRGWFWVEVPRS